LVNEYIQVDDSGLWVVFSDIYENVAASLKNARILKKIQRDFDVAEARRIANALRVSQLSRMSSVRISDGGNGAGRGGNENDENTYNEDSYNENSYSDDDGDVSSADSFFGMNSYDDGFGHQSSADSDAGDGTGKRSPLTPDEQSLLSMFTKDLHSCLLAMRVQQLLCEGHNLRMQNYIFSQTDNSRSINFVEKSVDLILRFCFDEEACDQVDEEEVDMLIQATDLIIELLQGPCDSNQKFCSLSGLVEGTQKILKSRFEGLQMYDEESGEYQADPDKRNAYPSKVRELKSKLGLAMLSLLELRADSEVHKNVLFRCDPFVMKERVIFVHRYFLSRVLKLDQAGREEKERLENGGKALDDSSADGTSARLSSKRTSGRTSGRLSGRTSGRNSGAGRISSASMKSKYGDGSKRSPPPKLTNLNDLTEADSIVLTKENIATPTTLVESFVDDELKDYFDEAWNLLMLLHSLRPVDREFAFATLPNSTLCKTHIKRTAFVSERLYSKAIEKQEYERKYQLAYDFFNRWLKSIEMIVNEKLFEVWFRMPVLCDFVLGQHKINIRDNIAFGTPEEKLSEFIATTQEIYRHTVHTRSLSKWKFAELLPKEEGGEEDGGSGGSGGLVEITDGDSGGSGRISSGGRISTGSAAGRMSSASAVTKMGNADNGINGGLILNRTHSVMSVMTQSGETPRDTNNGALTCCDGNANGKKLENQLGHQSTDFQALDPMSQQLSIVDDKAKKSNAKSDCSMKSLCTVSGAFNLLIYKPLHYLLYQMILQPLYTFILKPVWSYLVYPVLSFIIFTCILSPVVWVANSILAILVKPIQHTRPFNFFLKNDSHYYNLLMKIALLIAVIQNALLFDGMLLGEEPSIEKALVLAGADASNAANSATAGGQKPRQIPMLKQSYTLLISLVGSSYLLVMGLSLFLTICLYSPLHYNELAEQVQNRPKKMLQTYGWIALGVFGAGFLAFPREYYTATQFGLDTTAKFTDSLFAGGNALGDVVGDVTDVGDGGGWFSSGGAGEVNAASEDVGAASDLPPLNTATLLSFMNGNRDFKQYVSESTSEYSEELSEAMEKLPGQTSSFLQKSIHFLHKKWLDMLNIIGISLDGFTKGVEQTTSGCSWFVLVVWVGVYCAILDNFVWHNCEEDEVEEVEELETEDNNALENGDDDEAAENSAVEGGEGSGSGGSASTSASNENLELGSNFRCPNNKIALMIRAISDAFVSNSFIVRRIALFLLCCLALFPGGRSSSGGFNQPTYFYYSFLLLDIIFQSAMLQNVIKAVTIPARSLMLTALVGMIVMYNYAFIAFYKFRPDFGDKVCTSIIDCTTTTIYQGMRSDIGSALNGVDPNSSNWYSRFAYDLSYFIIITTVLMNVIFGIILDTFGSLRDATSEREEYMNNTSFISCLDRSTIDKAVSDAISSGILTNRSNAGGSDGGDEGGEDEEGRGAEDGGENGAAGMENDGEDGGCSEEGQSDAKSAEAQAAYLQKTNLISEIKRTNTSGFNYVEDQCQNRWNYMNFLFYLFRKDSTEYSGPEDIVNSLVAKEDISWLPVGRCRLTE